MLRLGFVRGLLTTVPGEAWEVREGDLRQILLFLPLNRKPCLHLNLRYVFCLQFGQMGFLKCFY